MSIIIGSITTVTVGGINTGFQSVNWSVTRQPNRLWQLGSWTPYKTQVTATVTVSVTTYAGVLPAVTLTPNTSCANSTATKTVSIQSDVCGPTAAISLTYSDMYLTSYSYSKGDPTGFATESWNFQKWIDPGVSGDFLSVPVPTFVLQGRSDGNRSGDVGNGAEDLGITFLSPESSHVVSGDAGSVSAGFPGLGSANTTELGLVTKVGDGLLEAAGETGQGSANVPHQPIYLG